VRSDAGFPGIFENSNKLWSPNRYFDLSLALLAYAGDFADLYGTLERFSEQSVEHVGQVIKNALNVSKGTKDPQLLANKVLRITKSYHPISTTEGLKLFLCCVAILSDYRWRTIERVGKVET
jgi:hypothetical protein